MIEVRHLDYIVTYDLKDTKDIDDKLHAFYGLANGFIISAFPGLSADKAAKLFGLYASSYYGCELWSNANASDVLAVAWQKVVRRLYGSFHIPLIAMFCRVSWADCLLLTLCLWGLLILLCVIFIMSMMSCVVSCRVYLIVCIHILAAH